MCRHPLVAHNIEDPIRGQDKVVTWFAIDAGKLRLVRHGLLCGFDESVILEREIPETARDGEAVFGLDVREGDPRRVVRTDAYEHTGVSDSLFLVLAGWLVVSSSRNRATLHHYSPRIPDVGY